MVSNSLFHFLLLSFLIFSISQAQNVPLDLGIYNGQTVGGGQIKQYLGIQYGIASRFKPATIISKPVRSNAVKACPQFVVNNPLIPNIVNPNFPKDLVPPPELQDENCLQLNIWAPKSGGDGTVMVFFYGGGFQTGWIGSKLYDGTEFAKRQKVVVVTVNYRVGVFGFPNSAQIPLKDRNLGFGDQRTALEWVQRNIKAFGGDAAKVTIWGESAGSSSVDEMILTSTTNPPFRAGIAQSGTSYLLTVPLALTAASPPPFQVSAWDQLAAGLNCSGISSLECVTNKSQKEIIATIQQRAIGFNPVYDGNISVVGNDPVARKRKKIPVLMGSNTGEGYSFGFSIANVLRPLISQLTDAGFKQDLEAVVALYNISRSDEVNSRALITALGFQCPVRREALDSAAGGAPIWRYLYNATFQSLAWTEPAAPSHGIEVPIIFGTYNQSAVVPGERETLRNFSNSMQKSWADFAKDPQGFGGWSRVEGKVDDSAIVVWQESGPEKRTFLEADGLNGTERCLSIERTMGRVPGLLERSIGR